MRTSRRAASLFQTPIGWLIIAAALACVLLLFINYLRSRNEEIMSLKSELYGMQSELAEQRKLQLHQLQQQHEQFIEHKKEQKGSWRALAPEDDKTDYLDTNKPSLFGVPNDVVTDKELWVGVAVTDRGITPQLKKLCGSLQEFEKPSVYPYEKRTYRVLIIQESGSPAASTADTSSLPSNCKYLTLEEQDQLPYRIVKNKAVKRKNIGYLYAIHRNATVIFDIDDTQEQLPEPLPLQFPLRAIMDFLPFTQERRKNKEAGVVNPYRYFGLSHLRPRGIPLSQDESDDYTFQPWISDCAYLPDGVQYTIPIQQGLFVKHPDANRATLHPRANDETYFARPTPWQWPVAVDKGSFSPFYERNSIFFAPAFWGLYLPSSTKSLGDVHRGYWVQRLLWDVGYNIAMVPTPVVRDIKNYPSADAAFANDDVQRTKRLVQFLSDWRSEVTGLLYDRIIKLHKDMIKNNLLDKEEMSGLMDWLSDLFDLQYRMPSTSNVLWTRDFKPPSPVITKGFEKDVKKGFIYMTQTEQDIPPDTLGKVPDDSDVVIISWRHRSVNNKTIFYPSSTWTEGRNRLFQEALEVEKYRGYKYRHMIFTDDDFMIECTRAGIPKEEVTKCFEYTHSMLDKWEPAIGDCDHPTEDFVKFSEDSEADVTWLDAYWNSFHREVVDHIVPYNRTYDLIAWPGSQGYVRYQSHTMWKSHIMAFTKVYCGNPKHRDYARGIQMWGDIGQWIKSLLPDYFKYMLSEWPGGYLGKGSPHQVSLKNRVYDDMCSVDDPTKMHSLCINK